MLNDTQGMIETDLQCKNGWVRIPGATGVYENTTLVTNSTTGEFWSKPAVTEYEVLACAVRSHSSNFRNADND